MFKKLGIAIVFVGTYIGLLGALTWLMCSNGAGVPDYRDWLYGFIVAIVIAIGAGLSFKHPLIGGTISLAGSNLFLVVFAFGLVSSGQFSILVLVGACFALVGSILVLFSSDHNKKDIGLSFLLAFGVSLIFYMILPTISLVGNYSTGTWSQVMTANYAKVSYFDIIFGGKGDMTSNSLAIAAFILLIVALVLVLGAKFVKTKLFTHLIHGSVRVFLISKLILSKQYKKCSKKERTVLLQKTKENSANVKVEIKDIYIYIVRIVVYAVFIFQLIVSLNTAQMFSNDNGTSILQLVDGGSLFSYEIIVSYASAIPTAIALSLGVPIGIDILLVILEKVHPFVPRQKTMFDI